MSSYSDANGMKLSSVIRYMDIKLHFFNFLKDNLRKHMRFGCISQGTDQPAQACGLLRVYYLNTQSMQEE